MQPATDKIGNPSNIETAAAQPVPTSAAPQYQQQQQAPAQNYQAPQANNTYQQNNNPYNKPSAPVVKNEGNVNGNDEKNTKYNLLIMCSNFVVVCVCLNLNPIPWFVMQSNRLQVWIHTRIAGPSRPGKNKNK